MLAAAAKLDDAATVALGGAPDRSGHEHALGFALLGHFLPQFAAFVGFAIERLRDGCGTANIAKGEYFDREVSAVVGNAERVSHVDLAGGFRRLVVGLDASELAGFLGQSTRLEEAGGPKPDIDADGGHQQYLRITCGTL